MKNKDFEFDVENVKEAEDAYDYSDLEDLSLIPPKKKENRTQTLEDKIEEKAGKSIKFLGIFISVLLIAIVVVIGTIFILDYSKKNTFVYNYNCGVQSYRDADYNKAIEYFEKALTYEESDKVKERVFLYKCYKTIGQEDKAISELVELLNNDPYYIEAITVVAAYYYKCGALDKLDEMIQKYKGTEAESALAAYMLDAPSVSHDSGKYNGSIAVEMISATGDNIYYTINGNDPTVYDTLYTGPVVIGQGITTLKAVVINDAGISSSVVEYQYEIEFVVPDAPEVNPASGNYSENQKIEVFNIPEGTTAYYTFDGTIPSLESEKYTEPIDMPGGNNIFSVVCISSDNISSAVVKRNYNLKLSDKYTYEGALEALKYVLIKKKDISSDATQNANGEEIKFVYYAKRKVNNAEMYLIYYDIKQNDEFIRQNYYWGVNVQTGATYKVTEENGVFTPEEYK